LDSTAELLRHLDPQVVLHTATMLPLWSAAQRLPDAVFARIREAGYGLWLPLHMTLTLQLMRAVAQSGLDIDVVNAPFPDFVNPALGKVGLAPLAGCGNVDSLANGLRLQVARRFSRSIHDVQVYMVAPHYVCQSFINNFSSGGVPYHCQVFVGGLDVTEQVPVEECCAEAARSMSGVPIEPPIASSAVKLALACTNEQPLFAHAPGPNGLAGGYPILIKRHDVRIELPPAIDLETATVINTTGLVKEGIKDVGNDGTVFLTEAVADCLREVFDLNWSSYRLEDAQENARALMAAVDAYASGTA
jgi:hypothetical protein